MTHPAGNSVVPTHDFDWEDDYFEMPPWNTLVIYKLHVDTFNASEPDKPGSFYNVIEQLPYFLRDLGIIALEIMPP